MGNARYKRTCAACGTEFIARSSRTTYCGNTCRNRDYYKNNFKNDCAEKQNRKDNHNKKENLENIAVAARKAGLTYGQYVAKMGL